MYSGRSRTKPYIMHTRKSTPVTQRKVLSIFLFFLFRTAFLFSSAIFPPVSVQDPVRTEVFETIFVTIQSLAKISKAPANVVLSSYLHSSIALIQRTSTPATRQMNGYRHSIIILWMSSFCEKPVNFALGGGGCKRKKAAALIHCHKACIGAAASSIFLSYNLCPIP